MKRHKGDRSKGENKRSNLAGAGKLAAKANRSWGKVEWLIAGGLAIATFAVYGQVVSHEFISLDDDLYIKNNPNVLNGLTLHGVIWAFSTFHAANWHPLTWLSHMIDCQVAGANAGWHLLMNTMIHVSNTLLLFVFLNRVTGAKWRSAIVAALFALHPLHVESVAWAAERKDTLSTFFGILSLVAYARYVEAASWKRYGLVAAFLALGLMAKPMLVTWPFIFLLLDYWPFRRLQWQPADGFGQFAKAWVPLLREKIPLFALVLASMAVTYVAQSYGGAVRGIVEAPVSLRVSNALVSYGKYVLLTFWPSGLAVYYPFSADGIPGWQLAAAIVFLIIVTAFTIFQAAKRPYLVVGWLWFLGTLIPVIGLIQVGGQALADRYHYIPSIGLFLFLVFGLTDLGVAWRMQRVASVAAVILLLLLGVRTAQQVGLWRESTTLFERTLAVTPDNLVVQYNLGHVLGQQKKYDQAIPHFTEALRIKPDFFDALVNMGVTLMEQGKPTEAIAYYRRALSVEPDSAKAHMQIALALVADHKSDEALQELNRAAALSPNDADIRTNLGLLLLRLNRLPEAAAQLNEAVRLNPTSAEAHNNLGLVFLANGQPEQSIEHFSRALQLKPDLKVARDNLMRAQSQTKSGQK